jgi:hypothetical protein
MADAHWLRAGQRHRLCGGRLPRGSREAHKAAAEQQPQVVVLVSIACIVATIRWIQLGEKRWLDE